jgi:hypothetical protein
VSFAKTVLAIVRGEKQAFNSVRNEEHGEKYWEAAYKTNIGIDPKLIWNGEAAHHSHKKIPRPQIVYRESPFPDCREAYDWRQLSTAINVGLHQKESDLGTLETERGRRRIERSLSKLAFPNDVAKLRERIRVWVEEEIALNAKVGFPGRAIRDGALREIYILDGGFLFILSKDHSLGGEILMKTSNVNLFLPSTMGEAARRRFSLMSFQDRPIGTKNKKQVWKEKGYFEFVAW